MSVERYNVEITEITGKTNGSFVRYEHYKQLEDAYKTLLIELNYVKEFADINKFEILYYSDPENAMPSKLICEAVNIYHAAHIFNKLHPNVKLISIVEID